MKYTVRYKVQYKCDSLWIDAEMMGTEDTVEYFISEQCAVNAVLYGCFRHHNAQLRIVAV